MVRSGAGDGARDEMTAAYHRQLRAMTSVAVQVPRQITTHSRLQRKNRIADNRRCRKDG